jgi:hypothetical protein
VGDAQQTCLGGRAVARGDGHQRGDDFGEVIAHRTFSRVTVASRDRLDDRRVLGDRLRRSAGREHGAELEAHHLGAQPAADLERDLVTGDLEDAAVQSGVGRGHLEQLATTVQLPHRRDVVGQLARLGIGSANGRIAGGKRFEYPPCLEDLDRLIDRDPPHTSAAVALANDEAVVRKTDESSSYGSAAVVESFRELLLDQSLAWRELSADDRFVQELVCLVFADRPRLS